jgi:hypothetical protein
MKYQIGDEILVLHSNEEGKVVDFINDKMVMIEVRGVKFPAYMDQIDFPYFKRFTQKKIVEDQKPLKQFIDNIPTEKPKPTAVKEETGVWLTLIPKFGLDDFNDEIVVSFKVHLVNNMATAYAFQYKQFLSSSLNFELESTIQPFHDFYLHDLAFEAINDTPNFSVDFSLLQKVKYKAAHYETMLKLKPKQVFNAIEKLKENNEPTLTYLLFDTYPDEAVVETFDVSKLAAAGFKVYDAKKIKENLPAPRTVIDLHIEKLTNSFLHLTNTEIMGIQLSEFDKWYDLAVAHRLPSFIVIHGVGEGVLRDELHSILKTKREVKHFINQYDTRFGYGATEIFFK